MKAVFVIAALFLSFTLVCGLENINLIGCASGSTSCVITQVNPQVSAYAERSILTFNSGCGTSACLDSLGYNCLYGVSNPNYGPSKQDSFPMTFQDPIPGTGTVTITSVQVSISGVFFCGGSSTANIGLVINGVPLTPLQGSSSSGFSECGCNSCYTFTSANSFPSGLANYVRGGVNTIVVTILLPTAASCFNGADVVISYAGNPIQGEISDVNYDASLSPSTSWQTVGQVSSNGYVTVQNLLKNTVYEFRMCKGGDPTKSASIIVYDPTFTVLASGDTCASCGNTRPWITFDTTSNDYPLVNILNCATSNSYPPVTLEIRIQPCTVCKAQSNPTLFNTGAASYTLTQADISSLLLTTVTQTSCAAITSNSASPNTFTCSQYEIAQNISISSYKDSSVDDYYSSCPNQVKIHDNVPPTLLCPDSTVAIPTKTCKTTYTGTPAANNLAVSMCIPGASDFPNAGFDDTCEDDPRFGLVTPKSVSAPVALDIDDVVGTYSVSYEQVIMDGSTYSYTAPCAIRLSVLTIVYPKDSIIVRGITYYIGWASSIEYKDFAGNIKYETQFRIYLQEETPAPGQLPQIINLQELVEKTLKDNKATVDTFNISPATPLKSNKYYLIVQGRNSGVNSVSNPVLTIQ